MSNRIYFSDLKVKRDAKWYAVRSLTTSAAYLIPGKTQRWVDNLLLTPQKPKKSNLAPEGIKQTTLELNIGKVNTYTLGEGPAVIMVHGWSGNAAQFFPLMQVVADMGYTAVAYDQLAHGDSEFRHASMPRFVLTFKEMVETFQQSHGVEAIVAHSMGAAGVLNYLDSDFPMLLIAPLLDVKENFEIRVEQAGLAPVLLKRLMSRVEKQFNIQFDDIMPVQHLGKHKHPVTIVHDKSDRFVPLERSIEICHDHSNYHLIETNGLGHNRIIDSEASLNALIDMLNKQKHVAVQ